MAESFKFIFTGENDDIISKAEGVRRAMRQTMAEAEKLETVMGGISDEVAAQIHKIDAAMNELPKKIIEQEKAVEGLTEKFEDQQKAIDNIDKQILEHKELLELDRKEVEQAQQAYDQAKEKQGEWTETAKRAKEQLDSAKEGYKAEQEAIRQLNLEKQQEKQTQKEINDERKKEKENLDELKKKYAEIQREATNLSNAINKAVRTHQEELKKIPTLNEQIADTMKTVGKLSLGYLTVEGAKKFIDSCIDVRKELEKLEIQLNGMFGEKAGGDLLAGLKGIALDSGVYKTSGLAQVAETLNVYGEKTEEIIPLIREFSDVAMGNEQKLNSLATAMGRLNTQGTLNSLTLRTLLRAGFNPLEEMARTTGKSMEQLNAEMKAGMITTEMVKDALHTITSEGGKYYNMTERLSDSIAGEQGRLEAMIKGVYAEWGKQHEDLIKGGYKLAQTLVANLDTIGKTIGVLIATYGTYRTALIAANAIEAIHNGQLVVRIRLLRMAVIAQQAMNRAMAINPYVLAATAVVGLTTAIIAFTDAAGAASAELDRLKSREEAQAKELSDLRDEIKKNTDAINDETKSEGERQDALDELKRLLPSVFQKYATWIDLQKDLAKATAEANQQLAIQNNVALSQNVQHDTQMLEDLKKYRLELNKITFGSDEKQKMRTELVRKYPELFSSNPEHQKNMRENPEIFRLVNFEGQGFLETDFHYVNNLITELTKSVGNLNSELAKSTGKQWNNLLPKKNVQEANAEIEKYERLLKQLEEQQKPENLISRWDAQNPDRFRLPMTMADMDRMKTEMSTITDDGEVLTKEEITRRIKELRVHASTVTKNAGKDYLKDAKEAYELAQKGVKDIIAKRNDKDENGNRLFPTEQAYQEALRQAKEAEKQAKAIYEQMGGSTKQDRKDESDAKKLEKQEAKYQEELRKQKLDRERAIKDLEYSTAQATINAMEDGNQKTIAQLTLDFEKQKTEITRAYEDLKQQKIEAAKKLWEADPKTKDSPFDSSKVNTQYTETETQNFKKQLEALEKAFARSLKKQIQEEEDANREAINTYLKQYGNYAQKKQAIYEDANEAICRLEEQLSDTTTEEARAAIQARIDTVKAGTKEQINELDQQYGKAKQFMIDLFGDASQKSVAEIEKIIKKYEELEKFLQGDKSVSRESLIDLGFTDEEISQAMEKLSQGKITVKDFTDALKSMKGELGQRSPWQKFKKDIEDATKLLKEANGDNGKIGTAIQNIGSACSEYLPQVERFATSLYDLFGVDDSGAKGAISAMQGLSVAAQGVGQIISGDFMDGIVNAVDGAAQAFNGLAEMINDISTSRDMEAEYDNIELKAIRKAVDKIVEKFDNDTMAQAMSDYEEAMKLYEDELKKAQQTLQDAFSKSSSNIAGRYNHHSINYYMNDFGGQAEFDAINQLLGTNVQSWGDLWFLSPDQLAEIETKLPRIFAIIQKGIAEMSSNASASSHDEEAQAALDAYMELVGQKDKIEDAFNLKMTGTSFDSVKNDFKNMLADMTSDTEAFGEKVKDILLNSVANQLMSDKYNEELERWYYSFKNAYKNDGTLDEDEIRILREIYQETADRAMRDRDALMSIIGDTSEAKKYFDSLRDMWLSTLTDMEADAKDWEREILRIMVEDLISTTVLNDSFTAWLDDWKKRYTELMKAEANHEISQQERDRRMQELLDEQVEKREQLAGQAKDIMDSLGYTEMLEEADDAFGDLRDQFVDALMDMDTDAEEWGKQIAQTLARQFIEQQLLNEAFGGMLDEWKADVAELMEHGFGEGSREDAEAIERLKGKVQELVNKYKELAPLAQEFMEAIGLGKEDESATSPFEDLRTTFVNTLMDLQADAESFAKQLQKTLTQHLMEGLVDNFTVGDLGFNDWLKKWNEEYMQTFNNLDNPDREEDLEWYIDELVKVYEQLAAEGEELRERLKGLDPDTTFKDMATSWQSALLDMEMTAESFAENVRQTMASKIIDEFLLGSSFKDFLNQYQDTFNTIMDGDGTMNDKIAALLPMIDQWVAKYEELAPLAERIREAFGITPGDGLESAFSDMRSLFVSSLMDMEADADQFAKDVARTMTEQMIGQMIKGMFQQQFDDWNTAYMDALRRGDTDELERLRQQLIEMRSAAQDAAQPLLDTLAEIEAVADTTFKDMATSWQSALMDMETDTEAWTKNITRLLAQQLVQKFVMNAKFDEWLEDFQNRFNEIYDSSLSPTEMANRLEPLKRLWIEKFGEMSEEVKTLFDLIGYTDILDEEKIEDEVEHALGNLRSTFVSALMDMESDAADFSNNISRILAEAFIDKFVLGDAFDAQMEQWQNQYESILKSGLSEEERAAQIKQLRDAIAAAKEGYVEQAKAIQDLLGLNALPYQEATMNMAEKATYDQFELYLGMQTSMVMMTQQGNAVRQQILATLQSMGGITTGSGGGTDYGQQIFMRLGTANDYLLAIKKSNDAILSNFNAKLNSIINKLS